MKVEGICKDFKVAAEEIYKETRSLDFDSLIDWELPSDESEDEDEEVETKNHSISVKEAEKIFYRVGPYVETLDMKDDRFYGKGNPLEFVGKYCQKLEDVSFGKLVLDEEMCSKLAGVFSNVKNLEIDNASAVTDALLQTTFNLQKLEIINLTYAKVDGDFLTHLRDILEVILIYCKSVKIDKFMNFIEANPQLTGLDIKGCSQLDGDCLKAIGRKFVNLETLGISTDYKDAKLDSYLPMMNLPKLTTLLLEFTHIGDEDWENLNVGALLTKVATHNRLVRLYLIFNHYIVPRSLAHAINKLTKLQHLVFTDTPMCIWHILGDIKCAETLEVLDVSQTKLSADGLANVIKKCKKIRSIDASCCLRLDADFVPATKKVLRTRSHKLHIDLRQSTVCEEDVGSYDHNKLKLIF